MKLVVGLGNPGKEYINTRHNVGFMILDNYLGESIKWSSKFESLYYELNIKGDKYIFLKPQTYMNLSGKAVYQFMKFFKLSHKDILVIQDDLDLPVGKIRLKIDSSAGGHNGIKDIINAIGTQDFIRLKVGISNNKLIDTKDYVLSTFGKADMDLLWNNTNAYRDIIENFDYNSIDSLMNKYN